MDSYPDLVDEGEGDGMGRNPDKLAAADADWGRAVEREAIIRPLASKGRLSPADIGLACRQLGVRRARLYELLGRYRAAPVTSSLLGHNPGPAKGRRRLSEDMEALIETAMQDTYRKREKPSVTALHDLVRELCRSWRWRRKMQPLLARGGMKTGIRDVCGAPDSTYPGLPVHPIRGRIHRTRMRKRPETAEMQAFHRSRTSYTRTSDSLFQNEG